MTLLLYEQVAKNGQVVDPYSWRIRLALAHMQLRVKRVPITLHKFRKKFKQENLMILPMVVDGKRTIESSWEVAIYLERNFPESPTLFGGEVGTNLAKFVHAWAEKNLLKHLYALIGDQINEILTLDDRPLFEAFLKREFNLRCDLLGNQKEDKLLKFRQSLDPFRLAMLDRPFLSGEFPAYGDFILYGPIKWAEEIFQGNLLENDDLIILWKEKMDKIYSHLWPDNRDIFV